MKTNQEMIVEGLGGMVACTRPEQMDPAALDMLRCPRSWAYDCDHEWPDDEDCRACKRAWLMSRYEEASE